MVTNIEKKLAVITQNVGDLSVKTRLYWIIQKLEIQDNDTILDCGCGEGFYSMLLAELYQCRVIAVDADRKLLEKAKKWIGERKHVSFQVTDVTELPFEDETFDKIILSEVLEHIPDDEKAIKEVYRVLKKGGIVGITVPNHNYPLFWDPFNKIREYFGLGHFSPNSGFWGGIWAMHLRLYYPEEIKKLVEKTGFNIETIEGLTHYCIPFNHNILWLGKQFYIRLPVPRGVYESMEKFEWKKAHQRKKIFNPLQWILQIFKMINKLNDNFNSIERSSVCIALKAIK